MLSTIEQTGRQAFAEMRRLVGVLRDDDEARGTRAPADACEIPALLAQLAAAGLDADLEIDGRPAARSRPGSSCRPTASFRRRSRTR